MAVLKINKTTNYEMFRRSATNRQTIIGSRKRLYKSMKTYGFLPCFPIVVEKRGSEYWVKDGQHRLEIAREQRLPVYWVEDDRDFDIAAINSTSEKWRLEDYADMYAKIGRGHYAELLEFAGLHNIKTGIAACLLAGVSQFSAIKNVFVSGEFTVKDRKWADDVAAIYIPMVALSKALKKSTFLKACMAATRADGFDARRLLTNAKKCRDKLVSYSTVEAYLEMLEEVYNFGRANLFPLKVNATMAMRNRNPAKKKVAAE